MTILDSRYDGYLEHYFSIDREFSIDHYESLRPAFRHYFGRFLPSDHDAQIVDLACGCGEFLYFLQKEGYRNARGVDARASHVAVARKVKVENVEVGDALTWLADRRAEFDLISAHDFLEHLQPDQVVPLLKDVRTALRVDGTAIVSTPNGESPFGARSRYCDFTHHTSFTPSSLRFVLRVAGFERLDVLPKEPVAHGVVSATRLALWKVIRQLLSLYLLVETGSRGSGVFTQVMYAVGRKSHA